MKHIDTIIWDLDNTLYKFDAKIMSAWNHLATRYFIEHGFHLPFDETHALVQKGHTEYNDATHYFVNEYGYTKNEICVFVDKNLRPSDVTPCDISPNLFKNLKPYNHLILTMAPSVWAFNVLNHVGLKSYFDDTNVIGAEHYDFEHKSDSPRGIKLALQRANSNPANTLFVEDTLGNLKTANDHTNVKTAYLHHDRDMTNIDTHFVDFVVRDTPELLTLLNESHL